MRLIVGYVATRDQEEEAAAAEETDCNVAKRREGEGGQLRLVRPLVTLMWRRCGKRVIYLLFILILSRIFYSFLIFQNKYKMFSSETLMN